MALFLFGIVLFVLLHSTATCRLPASGHVARSVAAYSDAAGSHGDEVIGLGVHRVSGSGPVRKRFRLNRKTPAHLEGLLIHSRPVWKRLRHVGFQVLSMPDHTRRRCDHACGETAPVHVSKTVRLLISCSLHA